MITFNFSGRMIQFCGFRERVSAKFGSTESCSPKMIDMSLLIRHLCILGILLSIVDCCELKYDEPKFITSSYEGFKWPVPNGYIPVKEGQFKTYIEMRRVVDVDKTNKWELYKSTMEDGSIGVALGIDSMRGYSFKFLPYGDDYLVLLKAGSTVIFNLKEKVPPKHSNVSDGLRSNYFVYDKYMFVSQFYIYDLEKLNSSPGDPEYARIEYGDLDKLGLFTSKSIKDDIGENCFTYQFYCGANYDNKEIIFANQQVVYYIHDVFYHLRCADAATGDSLNNRCYYYLTHMKTGKSYYFPQDLKVSNEELNGTRVMLFPMIHPNDTFFDAVAKDSVSSTFNLFTFNCMIAALFTLIYA